MCDVDHMHISCLSVDVFSRVDVAVVKLSESVPSSYRLMGVTRQCKWVLVFGPCGGCVMVEALGEATSIGSINLIYSTVP